MTKRKSLPLAALTSGLFSFSFAYDSKLTAKWQSGLLASLVILVLGMTKTKKPAARCARSRSFFFFLRL